MSVTTRITNAAVQRWWGAPRPSPFESSLEARMITGDHAPAFAWHPVLPQFAVSTPEDAVLIGEVCELGGAAAPTARGRHSGATLPPGESMWLRLTLAHPSMVC